MKNLLKVTLLALIMLIAQYSSAQTSNTLKGTCLGSDKLTFGYADSLLYSKFPGQKKFPLYLVDGEIAKKDKISRISISDIEYIEVIKDEEAIQLFGRKGKNGVVVIATKNGLVKKLSLQPR